LYCFFYVVILSVEPFRYILCHANRPRTKAGIWTEIGQGRNGSKNQCSDSTQANCNQLAGLGTDSLSRMEVVENYRGEDGLIVARLAVVGWVYL
jgi:hypothetical protein